MTSGPGSRTFSFARILLGVTLLAAPVPFGAVYSWAWASLTIFTLLIVAVWVVGGIQDGELEIGFSPIYVPVSLILILGFIQLRLHLTLNPVGTRESLIKLATDLALFFVVIQLFSEASAQTWRRVGIAVLVFGAVVSFLSILQFLGAPGRILWISHVDGNHFGPYVDPDHYAGLMEMVAPISAAYVLSRAKRDPRKGLLWFAVLVPVVSLLLTGSRGGFVSVLVELAILGWVLIWRNPLPGGRMRIAATGLAIVGVAALFFWLVPTYVLTKLGTINNYVPASKGSRPALWKDSLGIFRDHPLLGAGMGSFVTVYPAYQSEPQDLVTDHAHSDYVEALAETGLIGGVLIFAALFMFIRSTLWNLAALLNRPHGWIPLGATIACCGLLIHSFADFNLHIPANAAWFAFCAGLATLSGHVASARGDVAESRTVRPN
jgi:O-antigen ligase